MCRFTFYYGKPVLLKNIISDPKHSIIRQSFDCKERREPLNGDGFGIGWYPEINSQPAIFKAMTPAWNNSNLIDISRAIKSNCILAHVRATTFDSDIAIMNCHPFKINGFMFCHNGLIQDFLKIKKPLIMQLDDNLFQKIKGSTDSEYMFALILGFLQQYDDMTDVNNMAKAFKQAITCVNKLIEEHIPDGYCTLNMVMTNGENSVISRYSSSIEKNQDSLYICTGAELKSEDNKFTMEESNNIYKQSVVVSSEPLCSNGNWQPVKVSSIVTVDKNLNISEVNI